MQLDKADDVHGGPAQLGVPSDIIDNLDEAQRWVGGTSGPGSPAAIEYAKALALIDIGRSLRCIADRMPS